MSVKPNFIPRTLVGVGGIRLFDSPLVKYPDEVLRARKGTDRKTGETYTKAPSWGIDTTEAAALLCSSRSSARAVLHRHKVNYRLVAVGGGPPRLYWRREQVEAIRAARKELAQECPKGCIDSAEARKLLGIARSTLYRYVHKRLLHERQVRMVTDAGARLKAFYRRAEVMKLAAKVRAIRKKEEELNELLARRKDV